ncbi:MAG: M23 family metallopeptidase [Myxococcales bacterium]|nr:M23 family metallopeptidase [Myxococcales bacterium]MCB9539589.1 M23 family metallopeptidase [Myxococcales bacterium]
MKSAGAGTNCGCTPKPSGQKCVCSPLPPSRTVMLTSPALSRMPTLNASGTLGASDKIAKAADKALTSAPASDGPVTRTSAVAGIGRWGGGPSARQLMVTRAPEHGEASKVRAWGAGTTKASASPSPTFSKLEGFVRAGTGRPSFCEVNPDALVCRVQRLTATRADAPNRESNDFGFSGQNYGTAGGGVRQGARPALEPAVCRGAFGYADLPAACRGVDAFHIDSVARRFRDIDEQGNVTFADADSAGNPGLYRVFSYGSPDVGPRGGIDRLLSVFLRRLSRWYPPVFSGVELITATDPCSDVRVGTGYLQDDVNTAVRHAGIDYRVLRNDCRPFPIRAIADGRVVAVFRHPSSGNQILIQHAGPPIVRTLYRHVADGRLRDLSYAEGALEFCNRHGCSGDQRQRATQKVDEVQRVRSGTATACEVARWGTEEERIRVVPGDLVRAGQVIGFAGNTGFDTSGTHLHFDSFVFGLEAASGRPVWYWFDPYGIYGRDECYEGQYPTGPSAEPPKHPSIFMRLFWAFGAATASTTLVAAVAEYREAGRWSLRTLCQGERPGEVAGSFGPGLREFVHSLRSDELDSAIRERLPRGLYPSQIRAAHISGSPLYSAVFEELSEGLGAMDVAWALGQDQRDLEASIRRQGDEWTMVDLGMVARERDAVYTGVWLRLGRRASLALFGLDELGLEQARAAWDGAGLASLWRLAEHEGPRGRLFSGLWRDDIGHATEHAWVPSNSLTDWAAENTQADRMLSLAVGVGRLSLILRS